MFNVQYASLLALEEQYTSKYKYASKLVKLFGYLNMIFYEGLCFCETKMELSNCYTLSQLRVCGPGDQVLKDVSYTRMKPFQRQIMTL